MISVKNYIAPPYDIEEIKRYAKIFNSSEFDGVINDCISELSGLLFYRACYTVLPIKIQDNTVDFGAFKVNSQSLAKHLNGCKEALIFASTIGSQIDRIINKYGKISPFKCVIFDAIGAERIEALADCFCEDLAKEHKNLKARFSPGYGDFDIKYQLEIFKVLNCSKLIGLTLNDSLIMSPSKSVTAIIGM